tara:strand:- start:319 stop:1806 length:1488 start_codon:yes stop_codon:yes gene_type:complete
MNDPRLAHLPTREQYDMDLTRRRYGEEAIDRRADQLMGGAPLGRTEADAVRMAGREALDQRRQDRGMLSFEDRDKKREDIRMTQQEMFEDRRDARAARREDNRARTQLEDEARKAGMTVPEYQRFTAETEALGDPRHIAELQAATNQEAIDAQRAATKAQTGAQVDVAHITAKAQNANATLDASSREEIARIQASTSTEQIDLERSRLQQQSWYQGETLKLQSIGDYNKLQVAISQLAAEKDLTIPQLLAMAGEYSTNTGVDISTASNMFLQGANVARASGIIKDTEPKLTEPTVSEPPPLTGETPPPTEPPAAEPPPARTRVTDEDRGRGPKAAQPAGATIASEAMEGWMEPTRNIKNTFFGFGGVSRAEIPVLKGHFVAMQDTGDEIARLGETDPVAASRAAREILAAMKRGDDDWTVDSTTGFGQNREAAEMGYGKKGYVAHLIEFAEGRFDGWAESRWDREDPFFRTMSFLDIKTTGSKRAFRKPREHRGR